MNLSVDFRSLYSDKLFVCRAYVRPWVGWCTRGLPFIQCDHCELHSV